MGMGPAGKGVGGGAGPGGEEEPPAGAGPFPPAAPAAPTISSTFNKVFFDFTCLPFPALPLEVLVWAMMTLALLVPEVAVTLILKRPASSFCAKPFVSARPSAPVRAV